MPWKIFLGNLRNISNWGMLRWKKEVVEAISLWPELTYSKPQFAKSLNPYLQTEYLTATIERFSQDATRYSCAYLQESLIRDKQHGFLQHHYPSHNLGSP